MYKMEEEKQKTYCERKRFGLGRSLLYALGIAVLSSSGISSCFNKSKDLEMVVQEETTVSPYDEGLAPVKDAPKPVQEPKEDPKDLRLSFTNSSRAGKSASGIVENRVVYLGNYRENREYALESSFVENGVVKQETLFDPSRDELKGINWLHITGSRPMFYELDVEGEKGIGFNAYYNDADFDNYRAIFSLNPNVEKGSEKRLKEIFRARTEEEDFYSKGLSEDEKRFIVQKTRSRYFSIPIGSERIEGFGNLNNPENPVKRASQEDIDYVEGKYKKHMENLINNVLSPDIYIAPGDNQGWDFYQVVGEKDKIGGKDE